ncbi:asparagine synthase-related protein [Idiomarina sp. M1R2S28]|uniref:asparagine synthase (glutamine-hydrolyzing) n=1 Tax=Idiomarina rhizosphaerae TaxID=2961572 RepID=A0A9X2JQN4_9GAMM|nr:asparagine synthase-related protein [Idiomarina rhizosphaerae]MCP1338547.1 asparagine synthase-related protein [Idiomarina rhizosphaerae]
MINQYNSSQAGLELTSDLAGEFPLYLYWPEDQSTLLYTDSITELLNDARVPKPLKVSNEGICFLLQSGVVPPPKTAYRDIYVLGIGDMAKVSSVGGKIEIKFSHEFPFLNANRLTEDEMQPDEGLILKMLADATINRIDKSKPIFLFHSAGKDSNSVALALAEAGWQDKVTLITHKSKGNADESEVSAKIAKKLGFRHQILHEIDYLQGEHKQAIKDYFINAPFPCTDNVTLAYPLYAYQLPELKGANIIDGGGNDSYMCTPPTKREKIAIPFAKLTTPFRVLRSYVNSESVVSPLLRTPAEWCGTGGMSYADTKRLVKGAINVQRYWETISKERKEMELFDFKTSILTPIVASELHIRKARNFSSSISGNLILPFMNQSVAEYFQNLPEEYLFDRVTLNNKLTLRNVLKKRIGLDSDAIGKMGWTYNSPKIVKKNLDFMLCEIDKCSLWSETKGIVVDRLKNNIGKDNWSSIMASKMIYRLFLLSGWYNSNRFLK